MPHFSERLRNLPKFDGSFDAFKLAAGGCDVLMASYPAGTRLETHTHETYNVGVITQGAMMISVDGKERRYEIGDWYELAAGTPLTRPGPKKTPRRSSSGSMTERRRCVAMLAKRCRIDEKRIYTSPGLDGIDRVISYRGEDQYSRVTPAAGR